MVHMIVDKYLFLSNRKHCNVQNAIQTLLWPIKVGVPPFEIDIH